MKSVIRFHATQKPDGKEYKKIAYWNRFVRVKLETSILLLLIAVSLGSGIFRLMNGTMDTFWAIVCVVFLFYPFLTFAQFNTSIRYHLKHRDPAEIAPCEFCIMENGILIDVYEQNVHSMVRYDEITHIYTNVFGYYMLFQKNKVLAMFKHSDIPEGHRDEFETMMFSAMNHSCKVSKFL